MEILGYNRRYRHIDEREYVARDSWELVEKLRNASIMTPGKDIEDYMSLFAERAYILLGIRISHDCPNSFVADLLKYRIIEEIVLQ